jgi:hypothetical protein
MTDFFSGVCKSIFYGDRINPFYLPLSRMNLFKRNFTLFIALVMIAQAFIKTSVVVYYYANKAEIVQTLCVNRNTPEKTCAGKCMLDTWMKKADADDSPQVPGAPVLKNIQDLVLFFEVPDEFQLPFNAPVESPGFPVAADGQYPIFPKDIFHPPA